MRLDTSSLESIIPDGYEQPFTINLAPVDFVTPWGVAGLASLLFDCVGRGYKFNLKLPEDHNVLAYLKRVHFETVFKELGLTQYCQELDRIKIQEHEAADMLLELMRLQRRQEDFYFKFSHITRLFQMLGMDEQKADYIASVIGEMVDNTFGHNSGRWPYNQYVGGFLVAQRYRGLRELEIALADVGVGIKATLTSNPLYAHIKTDQEAIIKALEKGVTSRPQQRGGNGFPYILESLKNGFKGTIDIWSGKCHLRIGEKEIKIISDKKWLIGTTIALKVTY